VVRGDRKTSQDPQDAGNHKTVMTAGKLMTGMNLQQIPELQPQQAIQRTFITIFAHDFIITVLPDFSVRDIHEFWFPVSRRNNRPFTGCNPFPEVITTPLPVHVQAVT